MINSKHQRKRQIFKSFYIMKVNYCYDKTEKKKSGWYCVIIRNLPFRKTSSEIVTLLSSKGFNVNYCFEPIRLRNSFCTLVVVDSIETAFGIIFFIKKFPQLKAHIHPNSCKFGRKAKYFSYLYEEGNIVNTQSTQFLSKKRKVELNK